MRPALWKAALAGLVLFILGVAAGAATIDMLNEEDGAPAVEGGLTITTVETMTTVTPAETVTVEGQADVVRPFWSVCSNMRRGYSIAYPSGWYTTHLGPAQACEYFDPDRFEIFPGTEFPPTALFAALTQESVETYVGQLTDPMFFETLQREETRVNRRPAILVEVEATGEGESEPGERTYGYVIEVGCIGGVCRKAGRAFVVLATGLPGDERYEDFKLVVDEAVETVRFF
jgi:hypothetical protein